MKDIIDNCPVCGEPVLESDEDTDKFDPTRPMWIAEVEEYGSPVCHLGCSDELFEETHCSTDGFEEVTKSYDGG